MNLDILICPTNLLTQKQLQEIADLTTFCHRHDGIELSYPVEEEHLTHFLGYLEDGRLAACLTLISYEETLAECCAFTHPEFRRQGFFSRLLDEAVSQYPDVDLLFAVSEDCADAIKTLAALGAEKDSDEHMMACDLNSWHMGQQAGISDGTIVSHPFCYCSRVAQTATDFADASHSKSAKSAATAVSYGIFSSENAYPCTVTPFSLNRTSETEYTLFRSGILCGTTSAEPVSQTTVCLHHVEVLPEFRNQGCGTAFLQLLLPDLAQKGFKKVILQVAGDNAPAIALYKKTGFSVTKTLSYYFY